MTQKRSFISLSHGEKRVLRVGMICANTEETEEEAEKNYCNYHPSSERRSFFFCGPATRDLSMVMVVAAFGGAPC